MIKFSLERNGFKTTFEFQETIDTMVTYDLMHGIYGSLISVGLNKEQVLNEIKDFIEDIENPDIFGENFL